MSKSTQTRKAVKTKRRTQPAPRSPEASPAAVADESGESLFPIVGVGASAGGLEAFTDLLRSMPPDPGVALVFVQHLDPTHESLLAPLLAKATGLPVLLVVDGMTVESNYVYVIPPDKNMAILNGRLNLIPRADTVGRHLPIDYFFRSLADDQKNRAVGVILSGTGADGTLGLRAIKAEGGLTFVQNTESAQYDGMPSSAIAAEVADSVLPPKGIAGELAQLGRHPYLRQALKTETEFPAEADSALNKILIALRMETGINFAQYKPTTIRRRLARRMALHKIDALSVYARFLKENSTELAQLYQDLLINVTGFFRDPETFDTLQREVLPTLVRDRGRGTPFRFWVPGCSTGEEAYSIAMVLLEVLGDRAADRSLQIFATDVSDSAIDQARAGVYPESIVADISPERLRRFFVQVEHGYQVSKALRALCVFSRQDLTRDPPFSKLDLISCRNVLIYMGPALQKIIIPTFHFALNPGGILMLGTSETIGEFSDLFRLMDKKGKIYAKKSAAPRLGHDLAMNRDGDKSKTDRPPVPVLKSEFDVQKAADQIALAKYAPAGVLVNENLEVMQFRGHTGLYLEPAPGAASLNLFKLARPGLAVALRAALDQARKAARSVRKTGVQFKANGGFKTVNLEVIPIKALLASKENYFLVLFEAIPATVSKSVKGQTSKTRRPVAASPAEERRSAQLEQELAATQAYLESLIEQHEHTNEELHAAMEEIQSSNEELQSTNEELETAKEELQATNEELTTVNEELQNRNLELGGVNNDLVNLLTSVSIPVLILGSDFRIRRFTFPAEAALGLIPADVGRPLDDLKLRLVVPDLAAQIQQVVETLEVREVEVQDREGHWYSLRLRPYQTVDHRIDGVVLVLVDIDQSKRRTDEIQEARDYAQAIIETVREPLLVLNGDLRVQVANHAFYQMFQVTPEETENRPLYDLGDRQWDLPRLRELLEKILPTNSRFEDFQVDEEFPRVGRKRLVLNARRIERGNESTPLILLAMEEAKL
jgi:two-component system CheB/CheR fusion protein